MTDPRQALVAGAAGFLGQAIVRALVEAGWSVTGLARRAEQASSITAQGGQAVIGDLLDAELVRTASAGCTAIVHVAASDSSGPDGKTGAERVRVHGATNLLSAARANAVQRLVIGSGYWVYADNAGTITEESPLDPRGESQINYRAEQAGLARSASGPPEVMVVRPGMVYGDGAWFRPVVQAIRDGSYRCIGDGANPWSFVSLTDAGAGFARVVESGVPGEVYNLVDGHPAPWREFADFLAERTGRPSPGAMTRIEADRAFGPEVAHHLSARRACSARKLEGLGWRPGFPDYRSGVTQLFARAPDLVRADP